MCVCVCLCVCAFVRLCVCAPSRERACAHFGGVRDTCGPYVSTEGLRGMCCWRARCACEYAGVCMSLFVHAFVCLVVQLHSVRSANAGSSSQTHTRGHEYALHACAAYACIRAAIFSSCVRAFVRGAECAWMSAHLMQAWSSHGLSTGFDLKFRETPRAMKYISSAAESGQFTALRLRRLAIAPVTPAETLKL